MVQCRQSGARQYGVLHLSVNRPSDNHVSNIDATYLSHQRGTDPRSLWTSCQNGLGVFDDEDVMADFSMKIRQSTSAWPPSEKLA